MFKCSNINSKRQILLIENKSYKEAQHIKQSCDIFIDQVYNRGGWGYGMNSVEALSMGLCCITELIPEYIDFIPDHPFINVTGDTLQETLEELIDNSAQILKHKKRSREWVLQYHDLQNTANVLYSYYRERGIY